MNRREFIIGMGGIAASSLFGSAAAAQSNTLSYQPDFQIELIPGKPSGVDIALLGPNGAETTGFYAALDPMHGEPGGQLWRIFYDPLIQGNPYNTNQQAVEHAKNHLKSHGIPGEMLDRVYQAAKREWDKDPALRINDGPQP